MQPLRVASPSVRFERHPGRAGWLGWLTLGLFALPLLYMFGAGGLLGAPRPTWWTELVGASWLAAVGSGIGALSAAARARFPSASGAAEVTIDEEGVLVRRGDEIRAVGRSELTHAIAVSARPDPEVECELAGGGRLSFRVRDAAEAEAALEALGIAPLDRRLTTRLPAGPARGVVGVLFGFALVSVGMQLAPKPSELVPVAAFAWLAFALSGFATFALGLAPPRVSVGADGARLVRNGVRRRFVPFSEIERVEMNGSKLVLVCKGGRREVVRVARRAASSLGAVKERIELALAARGPSAGALTALAREGRSLAEWGAALAKRVSAGAGYREARLDAEELERTLRRPASTAEQRIGAALALRALDPASSAPKIRIAAELCESPRVRVALERVAERGDEAELSEVEAALADESLGEPALTRNEPRA